MRIDYIDNGAPQYNPQTERWTREWVDEERTDTDLHGNTIFYIARIAKYTIVPLEESEAVASLEDRLEAVELIVDLGLMEGEL